MATFHRHYRECVSVRIDSRQCRDGDMFFALRGQSDGNRFARAALEAGARFAVVDDPHLQDVPGCLVVPDTLEALQDLARYHRQWLNVPVLALTGSNGKTTTKELIARVLGGTFNVWATPGNYNNHIGVPLTLLGIPEGTDFVVVEMGASARGEISLLCGIARPDYGLITNIGRAHLEGFGGPEGVRLGKGELYEDIRSREGMIFCNVDELHLSRMLEGYPHVIRYGLGPSEATYTYHLDAEEPTIQIHYDDLTGRRVGIRSDLYGIHNVRNILTALTVGRYFDVPVHAMVRAISEYRPDNNRSQLANRGRHTLILDAYNANPDSMAMALRSLIRGGGNRKVAILGDMLELGDVSTVEHQAVVDMLIGQPGLEVVLVGPAFSLTRTPPAMVKLADATALGTWLSGFGGDPAVILIKGSRGMALETALKEWRG